MSEEPLLLDVADGLARLTLNRPAHGNAINRDLTARMRDHGEALQRRGDVRAVLLTAAGPNFCVGGDLSHFAGLSDTEVGPEIHELAGDFHALIAAFATLDAPVVAAVHGAVAGGGLSLACACDIVVAAESARFTMAYTGAGLTPDGGGSWTLPRIVGWRTATDLLLTNRRLTATEALAMGLVSRVVADDALAAEAEAVATRFAAGPTGAYGAVKRLLRDGQADNLRTHLDLEARTIADAVATADSREAVRAFLAKRPPQFTGEERFAAAEAARA